MCQGKRYYCCARDDSAGHLAENNDHFTVKHIALIRSSNAGRAELEMHLSADTRAHIYMHALSHLHSRALTFSSPKSLNPSEKRPHLRAAINVLIILLPKEYLTSG